MSRDENGEYPWRGFLGPIGAQEGAPVEATILLTAHDLRGAYDRALSAVNITLSEASIIVYVDAHGTATQTQIASAVAASRATTGLRLDNLEARGLVQRLNDPNDRRVWQIALTEEGRRIAGEVNRIDHEVRDMVEGLLTPPQRDALTKALLRVQRGIAEAMKEPAEEAPTSPRRRNKAATRG